MTNEVSVKMGYPFGAGAKATATVGTAKFDLFTKDEGAFVEKPDMETKLVEAMKSGSTMKIDGKSAARHRHQRRLFARRPERCARPRRQGMQRLTRRQSFPSPLLARVIERR